MQTTDFLWPEAMAAIDAAAWAAIHKARQTGTDLIIRNDDGKIVKITPDQAEAQMRQDEAEDKK